MCYACHATFNIFFHFCKGLYCTNLPELGWLRSRKYQPSEEWSPALWRSWLGRRSTTSQRWSGDRRRPNKLWDALGEWQWKISNQRGGQVRKQSALVEPRLNALFTSLVSLVIKAPFHFISCSKIDDKVFASTAVFLPKMQIFHQWTHHKKRAAQQSYKKYFR